MRNPNSESFAIVSWINLECAIIYYMKIKNYLWIAPFLSFFLGYWIMHTLLPHPEIITPNVVGKQVYEILPIITQYNLNLRIIDLKEEKDIPEGIILNQTPLAGTSIKQNQPLFIMTAKKPVAIRAPQCIGMCVEELHNQLQKQGIHPRIYYISHPYPEKMCFAQSPSYNEILEKNRLTLYISTSNNKPIIWPDFTDMPLEQVINFLDNYNIEPYVVSDEYIRNPHTQQIVIDQRPFAGTLLTLDESKPPSVQLRVRSTLPH